MQVSTIPLTAWEQAVIVVLFIGFVLALLTWFTRQQTSWQKFMDSMNKSWQAYLKQQRDDDRAQQCEQAEATNARMDTMAGAMQQMAEAITALTGEFREHASDEDARLSVMLSEAQKRQVQERKKKGAA